MGTSRVRLGIVWEAEGNPKEIANVAGHKIDKDLQDGAWHAVNLNGAAGATHPNASLFAMIDDLEHTLLSPRSK